MKLDVVDQWFSGIVPHNRALGLRAREVYDDGVLAELPYDEKLVGNPATGVIHGGAITSMVDAACGAAIIIAMHEPARVATLDLRIDYLKPATPGASVMCRATCYKWTRNVAFVRALAHCGDGTDPIASAAGSFIIFRRRQ